MTHNFRNYQQLKRQLCETLFSREQGDNFLMMRFGFLFFHSFPPSRALIVKKSAGAKTSTNSIFRNALVLLQALPKFFIAATSAFTIILFFVIFANDMIGSKFVQYKKKTTKMKSNPKPTFFVNTTISI